jgi:hypothetical protein
MIKGNKDERERSYNRRRFREILSSGAGRVSAGFEQLFKYLPPEQQQSLFIPTLFSGISSMI